MKIKYPRILMHGLFLTASMFFLLFASPTTSPFIDAPFSGDSAMFQTIGKYWAEGTLPYTGLWDSKGPIIFFINAIGYSLAGSHVGLLVIQILCLYITQLLTFKIYRRSFSFFGSLALTILTLGFMLLCYADNSTEEYLLPLLMGSFLLISRTLDHIRRDQKGTPPRTIFASIWPNVCLLPAYPADQCPGVMRRHLCHRRLSGT